MRRARSALRSASPAVVAIASLCLFTALTPTPAAARILFEEGEYRLELRSAFKSSLLLAIPYEQDPILFPDVPAGAGLFRLRFDLNAAIGEHLSMAVAYEHRVRTSSGGAIGVGLLPSSARAPFRLEPLDWAVVDSGPAYLHQHEFDRGYIALHFDVFELTVGRQAIGLGRGLMFSAVDIFSPFTPTEVDREWRRGVDAIHLELRIPDVSELSADVIAAFGPVVDDALQSWALIGRVRAILGDVDAAVLLGRRDQDNIVGVVLSANVGDAELHGELALFGTDGEGIDGGLFGTRAVVGKGLLGGSYMVDIGTGLRIAAEYHYSGFGVRNIGDDPSIVFNEAFQLRFARGDSQLFGRHAIAVSLSYAVQEDLSLTLAYIQSPVDGSGLIAPTFTWTQSDNVTILLNVLVPWGTLPEAGVPTSEWGATPLTIFLQARFYD
ncbi:MAG TPA: hypothetical protein ENK57_01040 [Polyangiaceae bacterium]|nr:hypothetical protein [Polyangiaceae bacterium]